MGTVREFTKLVRNGNLFFPRIWMRKEDSGVSMKELNPVRLGTVLKTADDFAKAIMWHGALLADWAYSMMAGPGFVSSRDEHSVTPVLVKMDRRLVRFSAMKDLAHGLGAKLCQAEFAPQICLQGTLPRDSLVLVGMHPIPIQDDDSYTEEFFFCIQTDTWGEISLTGTDGDARDRRFTHILFCK